MPFCGKGGCIIFMEKHTKDRLDLCITNMLRGRLPMDLTELEQAEKSDFENHVYQMIKQVNEAHEFFSQLVQGNLDYIGPSDNVFLGPAKDLQSSLRHILWQVERVAQGDYSNRVEFLGDFSKGFNIYIEQVALRENFQKEAALLTKSNLEQENRILAGQLEQQLSHYEKLKHVYQKIIGVKHDLKNHFFVLDELLGRKDIDGADQYLHSFMSDILDTSYRIFDTQNPIFDALLTEKYCAATNAGIKVDTHITVKPNIQIDNIDWCILLGNALDNAIEACELLENIDKKITIKVISRKGLLNIAVKNTALPPAMGENGFYKTSKTDGANHGLGLSNISEVVAKYDGVLNAEYEDGYFTLTCMLCNV